MFHSIMIAKVREGDCDFATPRMGFSIKPVELVERVTDIHGGEYIIFRAVRLPLVHGEKDVYVLTGAQAFDAWQKNKKVKPEPAGQDA